MVFTSDLHDFCTITFRDFCLHEQRHLNAIEVVSLIMYCTQSGINYGQKGSLIHVDVARIAKHYFSYRSLRTTEKSLDTQ